MLMSTQAKICDILRLYSECDIRSCNMSWLSIAHRINTHTYITSRCLLRNCAFMIMCKSYYFVVGVAVGVGSSVSAALVTLRETWSIKPPTAANGAATIPNNVLLPLVVDSPADVKGSFVGWLGSAGVLGITIWMMKKEKKRSVIHGMKRILGPFKWCSSVRHL